MPIDFRGGGEAQNPSQDAQNPALVERSMDPCPSTSAEVGKPKTLRRMRKILRSSGEAWIHAHRLPRRWGSPKPFAGCAKSCASREKHGSMPIDFRGGGEAQNPSQHAQNPALVGRSMDPCPSTSAEVGKPKTLRRMRKILR